MRILVDADGCPRQVLAICKEAAKRFGVELWTVASFNHVIESDHHITVGDASQEADIKIVNLAAVGDIVITQDWGLASILLAKGCRCLAPGGREYQEKTIDFLLEEREVKARVRRAGGRTKGPRKRTAEDDERFRTRLIWMLQDSM